MADDGISNTLRMWAVALITVAVLGTLVVFLNAVVDGNIAYDHSDAAMKGLHGDQCERPGDGKLLAEFQNTLSNLAYLLVGVAILVRAGRSGAPLRHRPGLVMVGASLCFLALCSGYYHATLNFKGAGPFKPGGPPIVENGAPQLLDIVGVYAVLIALFLYGVECALRKRVEGRSGCDLWIAFGLSGLLVVAGVLVLCVEAGDEAATRPLAGLVFALMLGLLAGLTLARHVLSTALPEFWIWAIWGVTLLVWAVVSYVIKPVMNWDSTIVFATMMCFMLAVLALNWGLSAQRLPLPELTLLLLVFLLGIAPRLLDGYGETEGRVFQKDFCSPDGFLQAHAVWHLLSALALALSYDMIEKSRPVYESSPATVFLPQGPELSDAMARPLLEQGPAALLVRVAVSGASVLLLLLALFNHDHSKAGLLLGLAAVLFAGALWAWPWLNGPWQRLRRACES